MTKKNILGIDTLVEATRLRSEELRTLNLPLKNMRATTVSQNTARTFTAAELKGGYIVRDTLTPTGSVSDVLPTGTLLVSGLGLVTGDSFHFQYDVNNSASSYSAFLLIGSGGTYRTNSQSTASAGAKGTNRYVIICTSSTTYDLYRLTNLAMVP